MLSDLEFLGNEQAVDVRFVTPAEDTANYLQIMPHFTAHWTP